MQCTNHIKQMGLGVHNFHDTQSGIPPMLIYENKVSLWVLIMPFTEQNALYDRFVNAVDGNGKNGFNADMFASTNVNFWRQQSDTVKKEIGSVSYMLCPTRRTAPAFCLETGTTQFSGPMTDYAPVMYAPEENWPVEGSVYPDRWQWLTTKSRNANKVRGPFRAAILSGTITCEESGGDPTTSGDIAKDDATCKSWQPRDKFAWMSDGTSNQLMIGEKHMNKGGRSSFKNYNAQDQSYLSAIYGNGHEFLARIVIPEMTTVFGAPNSGATIKINVGGTDRDIYPFGSWHSGVCNFLLGDGSVRSISTTTNAEVLSALMDVADGKAVSLP